jgi:hypothetical protein
MNETPGASTGKKEALKHRKITHRDTGGIHWNHLASDITSAASKIQKKYYYKINKLSADGTWPEPASDINEYIYTQHHRNTIADPISTDYDEIENYAKGTAKLQKLTSLNPDGTETLVFSLNEYKNQDIAHQAAHYLLANLQAELGITNTLLYADEILIISLQHGLNVGINRSSKEFSLNTFIENQATLIQSHPYGLSKDQANIEHTKFIQLSNYIIQYLTPKILELDPQILEPLEQKTVRYEKYIEKLRKLQESETVKANLLKKVKEAGTWEIPYGPLEGFEEFEFGEIPPLTGNYSAEVAEINRLIDEIDDRIKFKNPPKKAD